VPKAILIAGPTASGKSAAAVHLATNLPGTVINADSMQVYRELAILTARPSEADLACAPHRLYGIVGAGEAYSVGRWLEDAARALREAEGDGRMPILVGGTGLYFKALLEGLSHVPPADADVRAYWRAQAAKRPASELHAILGTPGCRFISLQYGDCAAEIEEARRAGTVLQHWQQAIDDYDETAALCMALDLTVSVCTAVIHLNGALGHPVWVMVPSVPEWRYGRSGESMPWYPSARLFRQRVEGPWDEVFARVASELARRASA